LPRTSRILCAVLCTLVAALTAGCGGGSSSAAGPGRELSPAAAKLVAQADPICKKVELRRTAVNQKLHSALSTRARHAVLAEMAPELRSYELGALGKLRTLQVAPPLASEWRTMLAGMRVLAEDAGGLATAAKTSGETAVQAVVAKERKLRRELAVIAERIGFSYCGPN
jgi:hypothetical protein